MVEELITKLRLLFDDAGVAKAKGAIKDLEGASDSANRSTTAGAERSSSAMGTAGTAARRLGDDLSAAGAKASSVGAAGETAGRATTAGMDSARGAVRGLGDELAGVGSKGSDAGERVGRGADDAERHVSSAKGAVSGLAAGLVALGAAAYFGGILHDLGEVDRLGIQTATTIRTTGGAANVAAGHVAQLGDDIERLTGIESEQTQAAANLLLTFTNVRNEVGKGNDVFDRATVLTQDLAVAGFGSASSAAISLGKALNDPLVGITALSRQGITFTDQQKAQIKALVATNDTLGAQKIILAELERQVGGSAEAFGTTLPGKLAKARNAVDNVAEGFVGALVPGVEAAAAVIVPLAEAFQGMPPALQTIASGLLLTGAAAVFFGGRIREGVTAIKEMVQTLPFMHANTERGQALLNGMGIAAGFLGRALAAIAVYTVARSFVDNLAPSVDKSAESLAHGTANADEFESSLRKLNHPSLWEGFLSGVRDTLKLDWNTAEVKASSYFKTLAEKSPVAAQAVLTSMREQGADVTQFQAILDGVTTKLAGQGIAEGDLALKVKAAAAAQRDQAAASGDLSAKQDQLKSRFDVLNDSISRFRGLLDSTLGVQLDSEEATIRAFEALDRLHASLTENGVVLDLSTEKGRENRQNLIDLTRSLEDEIEMMGRSGIVTDEDNARKAALINRLQLLQAEFPGLRAQIQTYIDRINAIPTAPTTTPQVYTAEAHAALDRLIARLNEFSHMNAQAIASVVLGGGLSLGGRMAGGPVRANEPVVVGEARPEIWWPDTAGTILPDASILERMARGGDRSVQVVFPPGAVTIDARGVPGADALADHLVDIVHGELADVLDRLVVRELSAVVGR